MPLIQIRPNPEGESKDPKLGGMEDAERTKQQDGIVVPKKHEGRYIGPASLKNEKTSVPQGAALLQEMIQANWLHCNDSQDDENDMKEQFVNENTQLALVNALLLTMCWSSFFDVMSNSDSFKMTKAFSTDVWVDIQITLFGLGCMGFGFATVGSVFYLLAASEMGTSAKVSSLQTYLGGLVSMPFYFFYVGVAGWGAGYYVQGASCSRSYGGMASYLTTSIIGTIIFVASLHRMIGGVFNIQRTSEDYPPVTITSSTIRTRLDEYVAEVGVNAIADWEFHAYLIATAKQKNHEYWPGLSQISKERVATIWKAKMDELVKIDQTRVTLSSEEIGTRLNGYIAEVGDAAEDWEFELHLLRNNPHAILSQVTQKRMQSAWEAKLLELADADKA